MICVAPTAVTKGHVAGKRGLNLRLSWTLTPIEKCCMRCSHEHSRVPLTLGTQACIVVSSHTIIAGAVQNRRAHQTQLPVLIALASGIRGCCGSFALTIRDGNDFWRRNDTTRRGIYGLLSAWALQCHYVIMTYDCNLPFDSQGKFRPEIAR